MAGKRMYLVVSTGINEHYGKKGQKRVMSNFFIKKALREGWIKPNPKYICNGENMTKLMKTRIKRKWEAKE